MNLLFGNLLVFLIYFGVSLFFLYHSSSFFKVFLSILSNSEKIIKVLRAEVTAKRPAA